MLRKRLVTLLTFVDGTLFRSKQYEPDYRYTLNFVDAWSIDEITLLDITRKKEGSNENFLSVIDVFSKECFVPLTVGGGIRTLTDVKTFLDTGADKITINTAALHNPKFITEIANKYGSQCVVVSIDAKKIGEKKYEVFSEFGKTSTGRNVVDWAYEAEKMGAGELLISSIDKDGYLDGYDIELCRQISRSVSIPVIISSGCGNWKQIANVFKNGEADAACLTNIYHFTETSIHSAKKFLKKKNIIVRV